MAAKRLTAEQREELLAALEARFREHPERHEGIAWDDVRARLDAHPARLASLREMEATGGEPDVIARDPDTGEVTLCDCSAQSPAGRRSLCYDDEALAARKANRPRGSAAAMAAEMGIEMLDEDAYRALQRLGTFDTTTSSWIRTPDEVRALGGAAFCDHRYGRVWLYHNGAESYYAARGFRGTLRV